MIAREYQLSWNAQMEMLAAKRELNWYKAGVTPNTDAILSLIEKALEYLHELDVTGGGSNE